MAELANWSEFDRSPRFRLCPFSSKCEEVFALNAVCSLGENIGNFGCIFFATTYAYLAQSGPWIERLTHGKMWT